jgi:IS5 family transposase
MIGHMKSDGLLNRNWLKGAEGDALHAILCGAGHNLRMILAHLRVLLLALIAWLVVPASFIFDAIGSSRRQLLV